MATGRIAFICPASLLVWGFGRSEDEGTGPTVDPPVVDPYLPSTSVESVATNLRTARGNQDLEGYAEFRDPAFRVVLVPETWRGCIDRLAANDEVRAMVGLFAALIETTEGEAGDPLIYLVENDPGVFVFAPLGGAPDVTWAIVHQKNLHCGWLAITEDASWTEIKDLYR